MEEITPVSDEDLKKKAHYDQFFCQDSVTITVASVYRHSWNPANADKMALITQLKEMAKARGYNVSESESNFTRKRYIHFKKYRLHAESAPVATPLALKNAPRADEITIDVESSPSEVKTLNN